MLGSGSRDNGGTNVVAKEEDWVLARKGIQLVLNNRYAEAQALFENRGDSLQLAAGHCYIVFMNAVMTFEDELLDEATNVLRDLEKKCAQDLGWLKSMRNKMFGTSKEKCEAAWLEEQIVLADCQVCSALLSLMLHDSKAGYVKGGWALRKAWRLYQHTYTTLLSLYKQCFGGDAHVPGSSDVPSWKVIARKTGMTPDSPSCPWSFPETPATSPQPAPVTTPTNGYRNPFAAFLSAPPQKPMEPKDIARLMSAISFGYGLFHLCVSLLPNTLLRLIQLLGFAGDRMTGLEALMFARQGPDMRAPLATLALLWYHTIVRPFFAVDGHNIEAGVEAANLLIEEAMPDFSESALFLFFKGKVHRLQNDIEGAVVVYSRAVEKSPQREIQLLCLHEVGWCRLVQLDFALAYSAFLQLKHSALWGKVFYSYLTAVCAGSMGDTQVVTRVAPRLRNRMCEEHLQRMVARRARMMANQHSSFFRLFAYEILYLWNDLPVTPCTRAIIEDCEKNADQEEPMVGLRCLMKGVALSVEGRVSEAVSALRSVLCERADLPPNGHDAHVTAFAQYELAVLLLTSEDTVDEGRQLLEHAQDSYYDYDFENRLGVRIHTALRDSPS